MDYHAFVCCVDMPCCVISVEKKPDKTFGAIRIVAANQAYQTIMGSGYYDGMIYSELVPKDNKFEDFCIRAACYGQRMHAYVETRALGYWTDQTLIPLMSDRDDTGYCQFIFEFTKEAESGRMSDLSIHTAETVIKACIDLVGAKDIKSGVREVLKLIVTEADAAASRIMLISHEYEKTEKFCEYVTRDEWLHTRPDVISYDLMCTWENMLGSSNAVIIKNEQDIAEVEEKNPAWAKSMRDNKVTSLVLIPLRRERRVIGYLYVINFDVQKVVGIKELIEMISFFLGSEIANYLLMERLESISQIDALTGLNNRRAMLERVRVISEQVPPRPFGVLNIDLNGLKAVNDHEGHDAGDRFLITAAELFKTLFCHKDIFRTGGDEFVIIIDDIDKETFGQKEQRLRTDADKNSVSMAVGSLWSAETSNVATVLRIADDAMYADKQAFYDKHPELRRK
ncbi:MAG: GGDEF domain-containing protein [Clostridia bacterium]|nr:GGDEF domain-containing protein [Clostridia bacterium]